MTSYDAESFIRQQVRKILLEEKDKSESTAQGKGQIFGGIGRGDIPKWVKEIFAGEDGSAAKAKRLATVNPGKLMSNLSARMGTGDTTLERANKVVEGIRSSNKAFRQAIGEPKAREDSSGRKGYFYANQGLDQDRQSTLFVFDSVLAASSIGYVKMTGHLRIEPTSGGTIMYNVVNRTDKWK